MIQPSRLSIGRYLPIETPLHRLDARTKIVCISLIVVSLFVSPVWQGGLAGLFAIAILSVGSGIPSTYLTANLRPLLPILVLTLLLNGWMTPGKQVWDGLSLTEEGLGRGALLCLRLVLIVTVTGLLSLTTTPLELADGIQSLCGPLTRLRIPVHELALTATIALRLIPLLIDEAVRIRNAQLSRGASAHGPLHKRVRDAAAVLVPLFASAFSRSERIAEAMEARGYTGAAGRTRYREPQFGKEDILAAAASAGFCWVTLYLGMG